MNELLIKKRALSKAKALERKEGEYPILTKFRRMR
jgi:hypothetical protein